MSEENKAVVRQFFAEVINGGNCARGDELVTADYIEHQRLPGAEGRQGIAVAKAFLSMMRGAFPDYHFDLLLRRAGPRLEPWGERRLLGLCYTCCGGSFIGCSPDHPPSTSVMRFGGGDPLATSADRHGRAQNTRARPPRLRRSPRRVHRRA